MTGAAPVRTLRRFFPVREPAAEQPPGDALAQVRAAPRAIARRRRAGPAEVPQLVQDAIQALAPDELHGEVVHALVLADAEDRHDVGMVQPRRRPRLAAESLEVGRGHEPGRRQDLERHVPARAIPAPPRRRRPCRRGRPRGGCGIRRAAAAPGPGPSRSRRCSRPPARRPSRAAPSPPGPGTGAGSLGVLGVLSVYSPSEGRSPRR